MAAKDAADPMQQRKSPRDSEGITEFSVFDNRKLITVIIPLDELTFEADLNDFPGAGRSDTPI
jgi:hypothetical protein